MDKYNSQKAAEGDEDQDDDGQDDDGQDDDLSVEVPESRESPKEAPDQQYDSEWLQWTLSLRNARKVHVAGKGDIFVTGAPESYDALEDFFGAVINCQAQKQLGFG
eukprot:s1226_g38.t1